MCDNTSSEPSEPVRDRDGHDRADDSVASSGEVISVALIDDNLLVREGIATLNQVLLTIRSVASGLDVLPDLLAGPLFSEIASVAVANGVTPDPEWVRLTDREREVLELIAQGLSNKAIARRLHISIHTVKSHLRNTMEKLTLHSRLELAHFVHTRSHASEHDGLSQ